MKKKQARLLSLLIMAFVFSGTVFVFYSHANATPGALTDSRLPQIVPTQNIPLEQAQEQLTLSEQVRDLSEQWASTYQKAGWIHVVVHQTIDSDVENMRPDGQPAPNDFITEDWILLDDNGRELKGVFLQKSDSGEILQVSVLRDKFWHNLTFGNIIPAPDDLTYTLDFGFPEVADRLKNELKRTTETINGKEIVKYSAEEKYASPAKFLEFNDEVNSIDIQVFYNDDGQLELYQTIISFQNGPQRISSRVEVLTFEQVLAPPAEVLDYLNRGVQK